MFIISQYPFRLCILHVAKVPADIHFRIGLISLDGGYSIERLALRTYLPKLTDILTFGNTY